MEVLESLAAVATIAAFVLQLIVYMQRRPPKRPRPPANSRGSKRGPSFPPGPRS